MVKSDGHVEGLNIADPGEVAALMHFFEMQNRHEKVSFTKPNTISRVAAVTKCRRAF